MIKQTIADKVAQLIRPELRAMQAYTVQSAEGLIKLDAMESPYVLPAELTDAWLTTLQSVELNRYPDPAASDLVTQLRKTMRIPVALEIIPGNGSDELIQLLCAAVIDTPQSTAGKPVVLAPEPGFVMYRILAAATGLKYVGVPLQSSNFELDETAMLAAIEEYQPALIFLAYPNNPTGNLFDADVIDKIIRQAPGLVIIDEAYQPFAETSFLDQIEQYDNALLMRTVSKLGLAGIRFGYLVGKPEWITELNKLRLPYNINSLTQATAGFALEHFEVFEQQAALIREERQRLFDALSAIDGIQAFPSRANFILFKVTSGDADRIFAGLKQHGVLIKNASATVPDCLRVTVGNAEENAKFLQALLESL